VTTNAGSPPFTSAGNQGEAILHYKTTDNTVTSDQYEAIANNAQLRNCGQTQDCKAVNCPFTNYHSTYGIQCVNVDNFKLLQNTLDEELPDAQASPDCPECMFFLYFDFGEDTVSSTIDGRDFQLPLYPPLTQYSEFKSTANVCNFDRPCVANSPECTCTHVRSIPYNKTIQ
ncbi:hypothetical protein, partial [Salmonella sp. s54836]|uniref:hypothetical protein n=1 Tax=Salmonella sp. s54836 TaxID=3159673 RepID=UPI0039804784